MWTMVSMPWQNSVSRSDVAGGAGDEDLASEIARLR